MRVAPGGAQEHYLVTPDITVISKAVGGGYPVGAFGASAEIMDVIVRGPLFHGGVFSGNAVVMSAAEAVLDAVLADRDAMYGHLNKVGDQLAVGMGEIMTRLGVPHHVHHLGPLLARDADQDRRARIGQLSRRARGIAISNVTSNCSTTCSGPGVYFHPNQFEPMFLSTAHTPADIADVLDRLEQGVRKCLVR